MYQYVFQKNAKAPASGAPKILYFANTSTRAFFPPRILHAHGDRCEVIYIARGSGTYIIGMRQYPVQEGDVVIVNSGEIHDEAADIRHGMSHYCCGLRGVLSPGLPPGRLLPEQVSRVIHTGSYAPFFENTFRCMWEFILQERDAAEDICASMLVSLLALIRKLAVSQPLLDLPAGDYFIAEHIRNHIDLHFTEECILDDVADELGMSVSYLSHSFRKELGLSPKQYIIRRRLGEAQSLLALSDHSVTHVSSLVGYDNSNYFSTLFSKAVTLTPREYRAFCQQQDLAVTDAFASAARGKRGKL